MVNVPVREIRLRFGGLVRPDFNTNVRQQAVIRKVVEYFGLEYVKERVGQLTRLQAVMRTANTYHQFGKLKVNFVRSQVLSCHPEISNRHAPPQIRNDHLVTAETDPPPLQIQTQLRGYLAGYDVYFMKHGNKYTVRTSAAKSQLQDAEQAWHDFIVPSLAARGLGPRPNWALEPLPRLRRVHIAPAPAATPARTPARAPPAPRRTRRLPPARASAPVRASVPGRAPALAHPHIRTPSPAPAHRPFPTLPTPPPSSPTRSTAPEVIDLTHIDDEPARPAPKRRFPEVIDVSDEDEDVEVRPHKKMRPMSYIDLSN
ncbi:hypothetical protein B0H19DRAFT_1267000 [Mycena capillaripes]|nr:hypothetical protein B0H19DRAFT_1267000 [Mycena capillaripes]